MPKRMYHRQVSPQTTRANFSLNYRLELRKMPIEFRSGGPCEITGISLGLRRERFRMGIGFVLLQDGIPCTDTATCIPVSHNAQEHSPVSGDR